MWPVSALSGTWRKRDGYLKSTTGAESNNRDRYMLRGQLYVEPNADVSIRLLADYSKVDENCCDAVIVRETELAPFFAFHGLTSDGVDASGPSALQELDYQQPIVQKRCGTMGRFGRIEMGFRRREADLYHRLSRLQIEFDARVRLHQPEHLYRWRRWLKLASGHPAQWRQDQDLYARASACKARRLTTSLDWLVGGFYSKEDITCRPVDDVRHRLPACKQRVQLCQRSWRQSALRSHCVRQWRNSGERELGPIAENVFLQNAKSFSIFTHNVINFTDKLSLTLGARYVDEKKTASFDQLNGSNGACQASVNGVLSWSIWIAPDFRAVQSGVVGLNCFPFAAPVTLTAPAALGGGLASRFLPLPREWANMFKDDEITYTAQVGYKANEDLLIYAGYSHGFKSGGFNLDPTAANLTNSGGSFGWQRHRRQFVAPIFADPRFKSEKVDQIEVGVKATFGPIKANLALFDMKMSDFQVLEFTGVQFLTFNVNSARSTGAELELFGDLSNHMTGNLSMTYANARYPRNCEVGVAPAHLARSPVCAVRT